MIYNTSNNSGAKGLREETERLISNGDVVDIKKLKQTRSSAQNRALHKFFNDVSRELNDLGIPYVYRGLISGNELECQWTAELFKEQTWKPIQKVLFGTERTRDLKRTQEIDQIFQVINKFFADKGIVVTFPNQFDLYLKTYA